MPSGRLEESSMPCRKASNCEAHAGQETQARARKPCQLISTRSPVGYESVRLAAKLTISVLFESDSTPSSTLLDEDFESLKSLLAALCFHAFVPSEHQTNLFFFVEEVSILKELVRVCREYHYSKELGREDWDETKL